LTERWRPLSVRRSENPASWDVHFAGVPDHLWGPLLQWLGTTLDDSMAGEVQRRLRFSVGAGKPIRGQVLSKAQGNETMLLDVVDATLAALWRQHKAQGQMGGWGSDDAINAAAALAGMLHEGSSAYEVDSADVWGLRNVVDETAQAAFDDASDQPSDAAQLLRQAWRATFKRDPDYSTGYWKAVQAVESVAAQTFTPRDQAPSLGKAIRHLSDTVAQWSVAHLDDQQQASGETLLAMLRTIWQNHQRHVLEGGRAPEPATREEAEAVLFLAVTIVQWFQRDYVQRRDDG